MVFARIWHVVGGKRRSTSAEMLRRAQRLRDQGRIGRAAEIVNQALLLDPDLHDCLLHKSVRPV